MVQRDLEIISTVRKTLDEDQRWGIVDKETMVRKYDFEGEIYVLDRQTKETQNLDQWPGLILEKEIEEALENVKLSCRNELLGVSINGKEECPT